MAMIFSAPLLQAVNSSGLPYSGAKLHFYQTGTTTPISIYEDAGAGTPHDNPVIADSSGRFAPIYVSSGSYKIVLTDANDVTLQSVDPVNVGTAALFGIDGVVDDDELVFADPADNTKRVRLDAGGVSSSQTRVLTSPNASGTLAILSLAQSWTAVQTFASGLLLTEIAAPATAANHGAVFAKDAGGQPELHYREESDGDEVRITYDGAIRSGRTFLATSGIIAGAGVSSVDFGSTYLTSDFDAYMVEIIGASPASDGVSLLMRVSTDGGSTFVSSGSYDYASVGRTAGAAALDQSGTSGTSILLSVNNGLGNATGEGFGATVFIRDPLKNISSQYTLIDWRLSGLSSAPDPYFLDGMGVYSATTTVNGIRFLMSSGNILRGRFNLYGLTSS